MKILFILLLFPYMVSSQSKKDLDEKYGFRDYKFGIDTNAISGLKFITQDDGGIRFYSKTDDKLSIGETKIKSISYGFYKNQFFIMLIETTGLTNSKAILRALEELYGKGAKPNEFMDRYTWYGKKAFLTYEENSLTGDADIIMESAVISKQKEADDKEKAKNSKKDF